MTKFVMFSNRADPEFSIAHHTERTPTKLLTSAPDSMSQIFTSLSSDALTMCVPTGEASTQFTQSVCPASVHTCHPEAVPRRARI